MRRVLCPVGVLLIASASPAALTPPGEEVQLQRSRRGLPVVAVTLGSHTLRLGLDTGTSQTLLSAEAAGRLGLTPTREFRVGCAAGALRRGMCARAMGLRVGGLSVHLGCVGWLPEETRVAGAEDLDGILGADALVQMDLWMDLRGARIRARIAPPGSLATWTEGKRLPVFLVRRRPAITAELPRAGGEPASARLILDSGSDGLLLFGRLADVTARAQRHQVTAGRIETATAAREVAMIRLPGIRAGGSIFEIGWTGLLPHVVDRREDGLLPLHALGPVLLDLSNGIVVARARLRASPRVDAVATR